MYEITKKYINEFIEISLKNYKNKKKIQKSKITKSKTK